MKKRKISLGIVLFLAVIIAAITVFISSVIGRILEKEIEQAFPQLAAKSYLNDVDFSLIKGARIGKLDMLFILENGDSCFISGKKVIIGVNIKKILMNKGKLEINRLSADSIHLSLPIQYSEIEALKLEEDTKRLFNKFSDRELISTNFISKIKTLKILDHDKDSVNISKMKLKKRGRREFFVSMNNGVFSNKLELQQVKMQLKNFSLSNSAILENKNLLGTFIDTMNIDDVVAELNSSSRKIRSKLSSIINFEFLRISCGSYKSSIGVIESVEDLSLSFAGSQEILNFGFNGFNVKTSKVQMDSCSFNITADDAGLIARDAKFFTKKESVEISGKLSTKSKDTSNVIFSLKNIEIDKIKALYSFNDRFSLSGESILNGVFSGVINSPDYWKIKANVKLSKPNILFVNKRTKNLPYVKIDFKADSLVFDTLIYQDGELSSGCTIFKDDSVQYNTVFSVDLNRRSFYSSRLYSLPITVNSEKIQITTSGLDLSLDSTFTDSTIPIKGFSTEILRVERKGKKKNSNKNIIKTVKKLVKIASNETVKIRMLSVGEDSLSLLEARDFRYKKTDTLLSDISLKSAIIPEMVEIKKLHTKILLDSNDEFKIKDLSITSLFADTIKSSLNKITKRNLHYKIKKGLEKVSSVMSVNSKINVNNVKVVVDTMGLLSVKRLSGNYMKNDTGLSYLKLTRLQLPEHLNSSYGHSIKTLRGSFKKRKDRLYIEDVKIDADGSRYYANGYVRLTRFLPCSLDTKVENIKLYKRSKAILKDSSSVIKGAAYGRLKFKGNLLKHNSWYGKGSVILKNLKASGLPLQKVEIITKYAPTFSNVNFTNINMNPVVLKRGGKLHAKAVDAQGSKLTFTGWGNMDFKGRFYFEMNGKVREKVVDKMPKLTQLALNKGDEINYGKFNAKLYGSLTKQYLVPEKGIHGKVIRSKFRQMGASFRNLFN